MQQPYKPDLGNFRFDIITFDKMQTDPNEWTILKDATGFVAIYDADGTVIDEPHNAGLYICSDFAIICYAIGWLHANLQEPSNG